MNSEKGFPSQRHPWLETYFLIIIIFSHSLLLLPQFTNFRTKHFSQLIKANKLNGIAGKAEENSKGNRSLQAAV